jgi:uncharacterized DUF497 family protein
MPPHTLIFEWSDRKAALNRRKHSVGFDEAETVFDDDRALVLPDELHSDGEPREILIGYSLRRRLLFVSFIQRTPDRIRLISARLVNRRERLDYEEQQHS